jgi:hypothetical protein
MLSALLALPSISPSAGGIILLTVYTLGFGKSESKDLKGEEEEKREQASAQRGRN